MIVYDIYCLSIIIILLWNRFTNPYRYILITKQNCLQNNTTYYI